jgi:hypothetical protein
MGRFRGESTVQAFLNIYKRGGIPAFYAGLAPKMIESASKGGILLFSKEAIERSLKNAGVGNTLTGFISGGGGGVCQVVVMGPCTYLVTGAVTGDKTKSSMDRIRGTWAKNGVKGFYPGGVPIAWRQATNWASRQGFTEIARGQLKTSFHKNDPKAQLTVAEEAMAGIIGGALACWNHPFEVARIQMQATADQATATDKKQGMLSVLRTVHQESGVPGLFKGIIPRICLGVWQTLFMVTGAKLVKRWLDAPPAKVTVVKPSSASSADVAKNNSASVLASSSTTSIQPAIGHVGAAPTAAGTLSASK